jgi:hypothetical protein
VFLDRI